MNAKVGNAFQIRNSTPSPSLPPTTPHHPERHILSTTPSILPHPPPSKHLATLHAFNESNRNIDHVKPESNPLVSTSLYPHHLLLYLSTLKSTSALSRVNLSSDKNYTPSIIETQTNFHHHENALIRRLCHGGAQQRNLQYLTLIHSRNKRTIAGNPLGTDKIKKSE